MRGAGQERLGNIDLPSLLAPVLAAVLLFDSRLVVQGARTIVRAEGWRGLYHGLLPTLLRDVPEIAMQFFLYERLRQASPSGGRWPGCVCTVASLALSETGGAS